MPQLSAVACGRVLDRLKPEIVFAAVAVAAGLCMVFVNAPFEAPDEASHFWRAYHVYEGNVLATKRGHITGGQVPKSVAEAHLPFENLVGHPENRVEQQAIAKGLREPFNDQDRVFAGMGFAALYSPVVYIPQVVGIAVARALGLSALGAMYAGRIGNLLFWIMGSCIAIRITPAFKWVFALVGLLPMNLFLAASLSADAPADCFASLLLAMVLRAVWQEGRSRWGEILAMTVLCVLLAFVKMPYVPLTGLILLIPSRRVGGIRNKTLFCCAAIGLTFIGTLVWSTVVKDLYVPIHGANAPEQMSWLMAHPGSFPALVVRSFFSHAGGLLCSFIGKLGFLDTSLPTWVYVTCPLAMAVVALLDSDRGGPVTMLQRSWIGLICVGVVLLVMLSMFLTWTPPGERIIEGVQGRYFLPIGVPVLLALFYNRRLKVSNKRLYPVAISLYLFAVSAVSCWTVYGRYFGPAS